jgi:hypothetical protein
MFKMIALLKRKKGLSLEEFIQRYEQGHALFAAPHLPKLRHYERRYIEPTHNPVSGAEHEPDFDVVTEVWFDTQEDCQAAMLHVQTVKGFEEDEEKLFDRSAARIFTVHSELSTT